MKPSFTILELVIVLVIIGILASSISIFIPNNNLQLAADDLIKNIRFTESLALKDDKYQPFPEDNTTIEQNRSKYWFKQWWQIRFGHNTGDGHWWYEIFSDQPSNNNKVFDGYGYKPSYLRYISLAKDPLSGKYLIGNCDKSGYPDCNQSSPNLDLTKKYGIKNIEFINITNNRLVFDNSGNVFLKEGLQKDEGDINPLDKDNRNLVTNNVKIKLCTTSTCVNDKDKCIQINITSTGYMYTSNCN